MIRKEDDQPKVVYNDNAWEVWHKGVLRNRITIVRGRTYAQAKEKAEIFAKLIKEQDNE